MICNSKLYLLRSRIRKSFTSNDQLILLKAIIRQEILFYQFSNVKRHAKSEENSENSLFWGLVTVYL